MTSPQCPKCGASLKDDYGMVTCPSCGSILFVDMEGMAHVSSDTPQEPSESSVSIEPMEAEGSGSPFDSFTAAEPTADNEPVSQPETENEPLASDLAQEPVSSSSLEVPESGNFSMDAFLGYQPPESSSAGAVSAVPDSETSSAQDPLGLSEYANSEMSQAKDGPLLFRILISGIDSKEMRESLREAIEDSRFAWDSDEIMSRIARGNLTIDNVSPVKAAILVNRIKRLPLQIRWEQYAIIQM